jgi:DNA-binding transcriptional ArsR family regulator
MKKGPLEDELLKDSHIFLHPERYRIMELLAEKPMHISELSRALGEERRLVAYHLARLEEQGFVTSKRALSGEPKSLGRGLKIYQATDKVAVVKKNLKKILYAILNGSRVHIILLERIFRDALNAALPPARMLFTGPVPRPARERPRILQCAPRAIRPAAASSSARVQDGAGFGLPCHTLRVHRAACKMSSGR